MEIEISLLVKLLLNVKKKKRKKMKNETGSAFLFCCKLFNFWKIFLIFQEFLFLRVINFALVSHFA